MKIKTKLYIYNIYIYLYILLFAGFGYDNRRDISAGCIIRRRQNCLLRAARPNNYDCEDAADAAAFERAASQRRIYFSSLC